MSISVLEALSRFTWECPLIVTGAGRGIGKAIALALAEAGADIVATARTAEQIDKTAEEIRKLGRRAIAVPADITRKEQIENVIEPTVSVKPD